MDTKETLKKAYTYLFPLVLMDVTRDFMTNTDTPDAETGRAPINQFMHADKLADSSFKQVVAPNVDTIYSIAWLDLKDGPIVLTVPETDRFCNVQVLDAWTDTIYVVKNGGTYVFVRDENEIEIPAGTQKIVMDTDIAWLITRIFIENKDDLINVKKIQNEMKLIPWNYYIKGIPYIPPVGEVDAARNFVPIDKVNGMSVSEFFEKGNELLMHNPGREKDKEYTKGFEELSIGAGFKFDPQITGTSIESAYKEILSTIQEEHAHKAMSYTKKNGAWVFYGSPIGEFGTEYEYRASIARWGLGANPVYVAIYPKAEEDTSGEKFDGNKTYKVHFKSLPPVCETGFWSVSAYNSEDFLIENQLDRYAFNNKSEYKVNEDGSVDIILKADKPDCDNFWLPVSRDAFSLIMRMYLPDLDKLKTWEYPEITVVI